MLLGAEFSHKNVPVLQVMAKTIGVQGYAAGYLPETYYGIGSLLSSTKHTAPWV